MSWDRGPTYPAPQAPRLEPNLISLAILLVVATSRNHFRLPVSRVAAFL